MPVECCHAGRLIQFGGPGSGLFRLCNQEDRLAFCFMAVLEAISDHRKCWGRVDPAVLPAGLSPSPVLDLMVAVVTMHSRENSAGTGGDRVCASNVRIPKLPPEGEAGYQGIAT